MEMFAYQLSEAMRLRLDVTMLVNRRGKRWLPLFLPYALGAACYLARRDRVQAIHLADALLAPLGLALKRLTGLPVTASVCGLDVTYANRLYQGLVPRCLARLDMTMPISAPTEEAMRARSRNAPRSTVIPLGVNPLPESQEDAIVGFRHQAELNGGVVLLTSGRLIKRKGVLWFVEQVLPKLPDGTTYVVIGDGEQAAHIREASRRVGVEHRLRMLGRVSNETLSAAYAAADIFVMPNVRVAGDMEGFGLVALEAAAAGVPVVASRLEGISAAIQHGRNGILVTPESPDAFTSILRDLLDRSPQERHALGDSFKEYTLANYGWDKTAEHYVDVIQELIAR